MSGTGKLAWHNVRGADWDEMAEAEKECIRLYGDIIDLEPPISKKHPKMSLQDRAAQFSPFAALTGFDAAIREEARLTQQKPELDEDEKAKLDRALQILAAALDGNAPNAPGTCREMDTGKNGGASASAVITWFLPDDRKEGGSIETLRAEVRKIDPVRRVLILADEDRTEIPLDDILEMEIIRPAARI
ncbi:MAG: hypothetical protein UHN88_03115 [Eubacterium sp.]|nr:hypothetical protein [Eubacterium sp.]